MASPHGPLRVGVGGPVGSGKTALMDWLCKRLRDRYQIAAITNDIYTKWDAEFLVRSGALPPERIVGVETGGCPHTAIREDASINLAAVAEMQKKFPALDLVLIESGGDNLAATFSPELADLTIYVIDVAAGDKIPSKGGPGITRSDLLVINKVDLAPHVGASLEVMQRDTKKMRGARPFVLSNLRSGDGVVELTVALHYVFDTPRDKLIWDVGHQAYPHKILTGRRDRIRTVRQGGGLSGFTKRAESEYDPFGAAHSSTSISAGLGMAVARDLEGKTHNVVCVIGDGAMSAGMAYEAMNNAGAMNSRLIVVLNDNDMSIAPPVGAMSAYLARLYSGKTYRTLRDAAKQINKRLPKILANRANRVEEYSRGFMMDGGTLFEELGFYYVGPIDGHNLDHLLPVLKNVRDMETGPILVHVVTQKGKGYGPAEASADKYHAVVKFDVATGAQAKAKPNAPAYQNVFGQSLVKEAQKDEKIVAITAAMPSGTGVDIFNKAFPERTFDVGIAEQHAVTFAAGLASEGYKPFAAIYSTFLQRAYDQVVHDVAIQRLPVRFALDRAGLVGADGPTHAGSFDTTFLGALPHFVIMAPSDEAEHVHMVATPRGDDDTAVGL